MLRAVFPNQPCGPHLQKGDYLLRTLHPEIFQGANVPFWNLTCCQILWGIGISEHEQQMIRCCHGEADDSSTDMAFLALPTDAKGLIIGFHFELWLKDNKFDVLGRIDFAD